MLCFYHSTLLARVIFQYDLEALDIAASKTLVAAYDGFVSVNQTDFYKSQLAPDGKIYFNSFGPVYYLHVIEHPDSAGLACEVRQHAIDLPNYHFAAMPSYPLSNCKALKLPQILPVLRCKCSSTSASVFMVKSTIWRSQAAQWRQSWRSGVISDYFSWEGLGI